MCFAPRAGGDRPRETGIPGEVAVSRPVLQNISFLKSNNLKLKALRVLEELNGHPLLTDHRVVPVRERQTAGHESHVRVFRHLVPAGPAEQQPRARDTGPNPLAKQRQDPRKLREIHPD